MQIHLLKFTHSSTRFLSHSGFDEGGGVGGGCYERKITRLCISVSKCHLINRRTKSCEFFWMERTRNDKREYFFSPASFCKMQSHWNASMWVYYSEQRYFIGFWINVTQNVIQKNFSASIADFVSWSEISIQKEEKMPKMAKRCG